MAEKPTTNNATTGQPGSLTVAAATIDNIRVLTLAGEIDHHTGSRLDAALDITGTGRPRIVIDLAQVTFLDSSGINILIHAHQTATAAGGWLRLAAPAGPVQRVLELVGIDQVIDCHPALHHALHP
jgi:stage II sporulation protein AA (anti-sigma F factor antagonist)